MLNSLLSFSFPAHAAQWDYLLRVSPDLLVLLMAVSLLAHHRAAFSRTACALMTAGVMFLRIFDSADNLVPMVFNRQFNLFLDTQRLPDFIFLFRQTRPAGQVVAAAAGVLATAAALTGVVWVTLRRLQIGLAQSPAARAWIGVPAACLLIAGSAAEPGPLRGQAILPRLAEEIVFMANVKEIREQHRQAIRAAAERALHVPSSLDRLEGASVFLFVVESYGMSAFSDPRHAGRVLAAARAAEAELRSAGFEMCSAYLTSPTFGGGSWLSHATLAGGVRLESQIGHDQLLGSDLVPLAEYFNRAGYRTVRAMPGTHWPWPEGAYYRFRRTYIGPDFGYRGPAFGFAPMPDQFVLDWVYRREARAASVPLFLEFILTGSHAAFDIQAPYIENWERVGDGSIFHTLAPVRYPVEWVDLSQASEAYSGAIVYELTVLKDFIRSFLAANELVLIIGDHQPAVELIGDQPWSVPVHVISRNADFVREFTRRGYTAGLVPDQIQPHPGMETLFWDLLEGFSSR